MSELSERGFSLLELLVVLATLALAAVLIAPAMSTRLPQLALRSEAQEIAALMQHASLQAVQTRKPASVQFTLEPPVARLAGEAAVTLSTDTALRITSAGGAETPQFVFFPDGTSTGGRIELMRRGHGITIEANWLTGHVKTHNTPPRS